MNTKGNCTGCGKPVPVVYGTTYCPSCSKKKKSNPYQLLIRNFFEGKLTSKEYDREVRKLATSQTIFSLKPPNHPLQSKLDQLKESNPQATLIINKCSHTKKDVVQWIASNGEVTCLHEIEK